MKNIGFISTWFERGAAYVTKAYIELLSTNNNIYIYARGGEKYAKGDPNWDFPNVTWGLELIGSEINYKHLKKWIVKNKIDIIFFNEQKDIKIIVQLKKHMPNIKIGTYIDYYKENTVKEFWLYDFLICNTRRHYSVFKEHPQCYYVPWGTDINLFKPKKTKNKELTFFHSAGMSLRKGTKLLVEAFIKGKIYENAGLIIHTQLNFEKNFGYKIDELKKYNIKIIEKTVTAPGLYHLGDVYIYPTTLDGLGLTMYEALAVGKPVITTNNAPMNEIIDKENGYLVDVEKFYCREDAYYWPLSICNIESLINSMKYYINKKDELVHISEKIRERAVTKYNWYDRKNDVIKIFNDTIILEDNKELLKEIILLLQKKKNKAIILELLPDTLKSLLLNYIKKRRLK